MTWFKDDTKDEIVSETILLLNKWVFLPSWLPGYRWCNHTLRKICPKGLTENHWINDLHLPNAQRLRQTLDLLNASSHRSWFLYSMAGLFHVACFQICLFLFSRTSFLSDWLSGLSYLCIAQTANVWHFNKLPFFHKWFDMSVKLRIKRDNDAFARWTWSHIGPQDHQDHSDLARVQWSIGCCKWWWTKLVMQYSQGQAFLAWAICPELSRWMIMIWVESY